MVGVDGVGWGGGGGRRRKGSCPAGYGEGSNIGACRKM